MGCCICRPKVEVTEDPTVLFYTKTRDAALKYRYHVEYVSGGILYVKDGMLCHESTCGSRLYCKCYRQRWSLSSIGSVNLVDESAMVRVGFRRNPGLSIRIGGGDFALIVGAPDAANFGRQLSSLIHRRGALTRL